MKKKKNVDHFLIVPSSASAKLTDRRAPKVSQSQDSNMIARDQAEGDSLQVPNVENIHAE